jgi:hypothetical protein
MYWRFITPDPMLNYSPKLRSQEREDDEGAFTVTALSTTTTVWANLQHDCHR